MTTEPAILPPPGIDKRTRAYKEAQQMKDQQQAYPENAGSYAALPQLPKAHPFAALTPGRIVHYVMKSGECRGAFVVYVFRAKGRMVQVGTDADEDPIMRQSFTLPDRGNCALQVDVHPVFDRDEMYPDAPQSGRWFRESVVYAPAAEWQEDAEPATWHWATEHEKSI